MFPQNVFRPNVTAMLDWALKTRYLSTGTYFIYFLRRSNKKKGRIPGCRQNIQGLKRENDSSGF